MKFSSLYFVTLLIGVLFHSSVLGQQTITFIDSFSNGNSKNWLPVTGSWSFSNGVVSASENQGHHFLMNERADYTDLIMQADVMKMTDDGKPEHPGLVFRWLNDTMNYVFRINGYGLDGASWIQLMCNMDNRNQNVEYIATVPWGGMSKGVWYTMKVLTEGSRIQCKVWKKSDPEPSSWNLDVQDTRYTHGLIGLEYFWGTHQFDNVFVQGQGFPYVSLPVWSRWGIVLFLTLLVGTAVVLLRRRSRPLA